MSFVRFASLHKVNVAAQYHYTRDICLTLRYTFLWIGYIMLRRCVRIELERELLIHDIFSFQFFSDHRLQFWFHA
jgi:hypothetical protein